MATLAITNGRESRYCIGYAKSAVSMLHPRVTLRWGEEKNAVNFESKKQAWFFWYNSQLEVREGWRVEVKEKAGQPN